MLTAGAGPFGIAKLPTGAGVGGRHQGYPGGEAAALPRPTDPYLPLLQGLAQLVEHVPAELRQLIEEQHAMVGQGEFPWTRQSATADQRRP